MTSLPEKMASALFGPILDTRERAVGRLLQAVLRRLSEAALRRNSAQRAVSRPDLTVREPLHRRPAFSPLHPEPGTPPNVPGRARATGGPRRAPIAGGRPFIPAQRTRT